MCVGESVCERESVCELERGTEILFSSSDGEREFVTDNLLARIHLIIAMIQGATRYHRDD